MAVYHRTKLSASAMLERAVAELAVADERHGDGAWLQGLPERLLDCSDDELLWVLRSRADQLREAGGDTARVMVRVAEVLVALRQRRLAKKLYSRVYMQLPENRYDIQQTYAARKGSTWRDAKSPARLRLAALQMLERDFGLAHLSLGMYCPPGTMSTKIAEVRVRHGGTLAPLSEYEDQRGLELTGGHLQAQKRRFEHLWRVHLCIDGPELARVIATGLRPALLSAIDLFVLNVPAEASELERIDALTTQIVAIPGTPFAEMKPAASRRSDRASRCPAYPLSDRHSGTPPVPTGEAGRWVVTLRADLEKFAAELVAQRRCPIDLEAILDQLHVELKVRRRLPGDPTGTLEMHSGNPVIVVQGDRIGPSLGPRARFTVAHELAHWVLETWGVDRPSSRAAYWAREADCNAFAAALIPRPAVEYVVRPRPATTGELYSRLRLVVERARVSSETACRRVFVTAHRQRVGGAGRPLRPPRPRRRRGLGVRR